MTYCVITARGKFFEKAGSDFLFQKKRYFRISEVTVREFDQKSSAQTCLDQHVPFADTNRIAIGVKDTETALMLENVMYYVGSEIDAKELGDLEAAIRLRTSYDEGDELDMLNDIEEDVIFVNTFSKYLNGCTFFESTPEIFSEFSEQEKTVFMTTNDRGVHVNCGAMLDLYCDRFNDTPGGGYLLARAMKFDQDMDKLKNSAMEYKRKATKGFNNFMLSLWK